MKIYILFLILLTTYEGFSQQNLTKKDVDEIRFNARKKIEKDLPELLNTLNLDDLGDYERKTLMFNSYLPSNNQVFYSDGVIVEDDLKPDRRHDAKGNDMSVGKYLSNFDLFYKKSEMPSIEISNVVVSQIKERNEQLYIKVLYTIFFKGSHKSIKIPFQVQQKVAELRIEKIDKRWVALITSLRFYIPNEDEKLVNERIVEITPTTKSPKTESLKDTINFDDNSKSAVDYAAKKVLQINPNVEILKPKSMDSSTIQIFPKIVDFQRNIEVMKPTLSDSVVKDSHVNKKVDKSETVKYDYNPKQLGLFRHEMSSYKSKRTMLKLLSLVFLGTGSLNYIIANGKYDDYVKIINTNNSVYSSWYKSVYINANPPNDEIAKSLDFSDFAPNTMIVSGASVALGIGLFIWGGKFGKLAKSMNTKIENSSNKVSFTPFMNIQTGNTGLKLAINF